MLIVLDVLMFIVSALFSITIHVMYLSGVFSSILYCEMPEIMVIAVWGLISLVVIALGVFTIYSNENAYVKVI